jgi:hypothetical protein
LVRWSDADHGVVLPVCRHRAGAIPEARLVLKAAGAGKSAVRAQRLVDVVLDRRASDVPPAHPEARLRLPVFAAAGPYTQAADQSAA